MSMADDTIEAANRRAANKRTAFLAAVSVRYDRRVGRIVITLTSGLELAFAPKLVEGLERVHPEDLLDAEITPSGLGLHFPRVDVDLYLPALIEGFLGSKRWMAAQMGRIGGATSTAAKAAAARENGKRGGRPKTRKKSAA